MSNRSNTTVDIDEQAEQAWLEEQINAWSSYENRLLRDERRREYERDAYLVGHYKGW